MSTIFVLDFISDLVRTMIERMFPIAPNIPIMNIRTPIVIIKEPKLSILLFSLVGRRGFLTLSNALRS